MPRVAKRQLVAEVGPEITGADVAVLWRQAMAHGPYPSDADCTQTAEVLTHHRQHGSATHVISRKNQRASEAAKLLLSVIDDWRFPIDRGYAMPDGPCLSLEAYEKLRRLRVALEDALPFLNPLSASLNPSAPVWENAAAIAWMAARWQLTALGRPVRAKDTSPAVRFAAAATQRMGFPSVTPVALAKRLAKSLAALR